MADDLLLPWSANLKPARFVSRVLNRHGATVVECNGVDRELLVTYIATAASNFPAVVGALAKIEMALDDQRAKLNDDAHDGADSKVADCFDHEEITSTVRHLLDCAKSAAPEAVTCASRLLRERDRAALLLLEKVERANAIQHSGGRIAAEDWSELYQLANDMRTALKS